MRYFTGLCILLITLAACHKSSGTASGSGLYKSWRFTKLVVAGGATNTFYPPADSIVILHLNSDNSYSLSVKGHTTSSGTFQVKPAGPGGSPGPELIFSQQSGGPFFGDERYTLDGNSLELSSALLNPGLHSTFYYAAIP
jgi:hypothetical protein